MHQQSQPKKNRSFNPAAILFLPAVIVFDLVYYLYSRSTCFQCGGVDEFVRNSSLTWYILRETWQFVHGK